MEAEQVETIEKAENAEKTPSFDRRLVVLLGGGSLVVGSLVVSLGLLGLLLLSHHSKNVYHFHGQLTRGGDPAPVSDTKTVNLAFDYLDDKGNVKETFFAKVKPNGSFEVVELRHEKGGTRPRILPFGTYRITLTTWRHGGRPGESKQTRWIREIHNADAIVLDLNNP